VKRSAFFASKKISQILLYHRYLHHHDAVKSWNWRLNSRQTAEQVFFITVPGTRGISPPNVCTEETQLLGIYAMLTYILITFPRNVYQSNVFSENSLVGVNVLPSLGGLEIILQPPCLCSLHTPRPKGIIQESLLLQPSQLFTKNQDLFWLRNVPDYLKW